MKSFLFCACLQIIKPHVLSVSPDGTKTVTSHTRHIMSNNTDMDPDLVENERYTITGGPVGNGYHVKIIITGMSTS